jgi:ribonuclease VapC
VPTANTKWGKGVHKAKLNFIDCFAYVTAQEYHCDLLFVGQDFSKTDLRSALKRAELNPKASVPSV